ncbi:Clavaminate synthase-like protein [Teratosphaeria destructans]|uniref:Clavaminate synthase-like protein n=1 Tax=Teratosphaeria destructans TaxID=418781 RepID=A0A9W7SUU0_9PEZI|nr:Clavaminate synthase-like protein [Teratosphaeria destructans]
MGSTSEQSQDPQATIPIIDFAKWNASQSKADRLSVAKDLTDACRRVGFVYIINHGIEQSLLDRAFQIVHDFFNLTHEQKVQAPHPDGPDVHRDYSYPGLEKVSQYMDGDEKVGKALREVKDCKESFEVGSEENAAQPNVWLPEETLPGFKDFFLGLYWECNKVAQSILRAMTLGIGLDDPEYLIKYHSGHNNQLRLLHYPPVPAEDLEQQRAARMPAHTDWGSITLLFQDDCGGLEVEDPHNPGKFVPATPVPGAVVMNVGDMLMRWSNDYLKSTLHRVTLPPLSNRYEGERRMTRARYSIPYFISADPESLVECLPSCTDARNPVKYEP